MIVGHQIRAARALLDWTAQVLAEKVGLSREAINKIEDGAVQARAKNLADIRRMLEKHGIEFIGSRGAAFADDQIVTITGENVFVRLLDNIIATLHKTEGAEALFACVDDKASPPIVVENYRRLRKAGTAMRSLVRAGDTYLMGKLSEYRCLPVEHFHNNATVIYGNKFATVIRDPETGDDTAVIIIHNSHVAAAQRNLFEFMWKHAQKPTESTAEVRYDK